MNDMDRAMKLMRIFVATIESLDQDQVEQLVAGKAKLTIHSSAKPKDARLSMGDQNVIMNKLNDCKDRTDARQILSAIKSRDSLESFARSLKVHVVKHDRREDIEAKIIEFVIGGKLRTEAISSLNLRTGSARRTDDDSNE